MDDQMNKIKQLSPAELAVLWLANSTFIEKKDSPVVLSSNSTLTLMIVLANGIAKLEDESIEQKALDVISKYSRDLVEHIKTRGGYIRYDQPVKKLIENLEEIGFPIIDENHIISIKNPNRSKASISYELANKEYDIALSYLEDNALLIDPPWYKSTATAVPLIVLLGSVPLEINVKTMAGEAITTKISAKFWDYESHTDGENNETKVNIKIAKFIDQAIGSLSKGFADNWSDSNPERIDNLDKEEKKHSKSIKQD
ncbi:hypothetical protein [Colwellia sp. PAMC 21821]|uniref:hypothetical protein n=1 Tax=Colwellia sp. PAMC 21821 TaxID=1816219 RepID=UPI0009BCFCE4|nr:hypothetical protein [Colwellia sp. PAMC 21821]ARD44763.1 hypothetical protein A3Q33_10850 [Colwellia sp. PAMC 21821]